MSNKTGRNDPCPCGSGKKYKRCCLEFDEAAAHGRARTEALGADDDVADAEPDDLDNEDFDDLDYWAPTVTADELTRICYTRGVVDKMADLRAGAGVRVSEWDAPDIPPTLLEVIDRALPDALEQRWGDPRSDHPMQIDIIDLETDDNVFTIEVFNRATAVDDDDDDEGMQLVERLCRALEAAASGELEQPAEANPAADTIDEPGGRQGRE